MSTLARVIAAAVALIPALWTGAVQAQSYPAKPITLIVTWPAGGSTDVIARLFAEPFGAALGQPVAVVNRAGGGGSLGTMAALDAPKDGYTVLMTTSGNHVLTPAKKDVGYTYRDFVPVGQLVAATIMLAVRADAPWKTLQDFVSDAKAHPGKYLFGGVPNGMPHLTMNGLASAAGLKLVHVPMKGGAPGATALLAGDIQALPANASTVASNLKAGKMRALASFGQNRDPAFPDVPTAKEQGYAVFGSPFVGVAVAKGVPQAAIDKLRAATERVAKDKDFRAKALKTATEIDYLPPAAFGEVWARDWNTYAPMLKAK